MSKKKRPKTTEKHDEIKYVDVSSFAKRYRRLSEKAVKKRINDIKGAYCKEGRYYIPDSARYPYNLRGNKLKTRDDRIYVLLKATSQYYYVDEELLRMPKASFNAMVKELFDKGLLIDNGTSDKNGVNSYDVCQNMDVILLKRKIKAIKEIASIIGQMQGASNRKQKK